MFNLHVFTPYMIAWILEMISKKMRVIKLIRHLIVMATKYQRSINFMRDVSLIISPGFHLFGSEIRRQFALNICYLIGQVGSDFTFKQME